jgi:hypothetical protein
MGRARDQGSRYAKQKGRSPTGRFARLAHKLLESGAYRSLSPNARALLVELAMMENGKNNGTLFLSVRDAADRIGISDPHAAGRAFDELEQRGFIACTSEAHFAVKAGAGSRARAWRLTWEAVGGKRGPSNEFEEREPEPKTRARARMIAGQKALKRWKRQEAELQSAVQDFHTHDAERVGKKHTTADADGDESPFVVQDKHTRFQQNGQNAPIVVVQDKHTHTADQLGSDADASRAKPAETYPALASGPSSDLNGASCDDALRDRITAHWTKLDGSGRRAWATSQRLSLGELRDFIISGAPLPITKQVALWSAARRAG